MKITNIPLNDQVLAILRVKRIESVLSESTSKEIAHQLDRTGLEIIESLNTLYDIGSINRHNVGTTTNYRVSELGERTKGCCCCCDLKVFPASNLFCDECGPSFDGRI